MGLQTNEIHKSILQEYKWFKMKLGDLIYYFTKYTGIKAVVDFFSKKTGVDCGCDDRRKKLNNFKGISRW